MSIRARLSLLVLGVIAGSVALGTVATADAVVETAAAPAAGDVAADEAAQRLAIARGKVVDQDGNPIPGVTVWIEYWYMGPRLSIGATGAGDRESINETSRRRSGNERETKDDGTFSYPDLTADDEYRVRFEKEGYIPREEKRIFHVASNDMGTIVMLSGNVEAARKAYETGYDAFQQRDFQTAISSMEEVVEVYGESDSSDEMLTVALGVLGQVYLQVGRPDDAQSALERLLEIRLDNPIAHRGLGQVAAMHGDMPQALQHFESAVTLEPENAVGRYLLGHALQLSGKPSEAVAQLEACLEAQDNFVQAHKSLGMALADLGETEKALQHLETYLRAAPTAPDAAEVQAKIAALRLPS